MRLIPVLVSVIVIATVMGAAGLYTHMRDTTQSSVQPFPSLSNLTSGTQITINSNDSRMIGGALIISFKDNGYYAALYNLDLKNYSIVTGGWKSTGKSLLWVRDNGIPHLSTPYPYYKSGTLNLTVSPGNYTLVIGGELGDVITILNNITIKSYVPKIIGNFTIPAGTAINSTTTYTFHLNQPGEMVGKLRTPSGVYSISLQGSGGGFGILCQNSSARASNMSFQLGPTSQIYTPGAYNLTLSGGFQVIQTLEFKYYYDQ